MEIDLAKLNNYDYYSKKLLYIQADIGLIPFDYTTRYVQREINKIWEMTEKRNQPVLLIILKARRHGVSTYVQSRMFHKCATIPHRHGITISADDKGCSYIHNMSHIFYDYLPRELQPETRFKSKSELYFDVPQRIAKTGKRGLKSSLRTVSCTDKAGLGTGQHYIHFSEYAFYRDADAVRKAVIPTSFKTPGTFIVIESTANGLVGHGQPFYEEWQLAKSRKSAFRPLFFSWLKHESYKIKLGKGEDKEILSTLDSEEKYLKHYHRATLEQLKWRREQIRLLRGSLSDEKMGIEYFHEQYPTTDDEAFIVSGHPVFNREILRIYKKHCENPKKVGNIINNQFKSDILGNLKIWSVPIEKEKYVVSIDPSSGEPGGTDFAAIEVFRLVNKEGIIGEQVAEWHGKIAPEDLADIVVYLAKWYNNALVAPEVFGYGHALLRAIDKLEYWNIVRRKAVDSITKKFTTKIGWKTDSSTKPRMVSLGRFFINGRRVVIKSEALVDEMMIFTKDPDSESASAYGRGKDDLVAAFLINISVIDQEYLGTNVDGMGVNDEKTPAKNIEKISKKDKLHYDNFHEINKQKYKSWLDL